MISCAFSAKAFLRSTSCINSFNGSGLTTTPSSFLCSVHPFVLTCTSHSSPHTRLASSAHTALAVFSRYSSLRSFGFAPIAVTGTRCQGLYNPRYRYFHTKIPNS